MKWIKRAWMPLVCLLAVLMLAQPIRVEAAETVASGTCGDNLTWTLDSEGTLTISGEGKMANYSSDGAPWDAKRTSITNVVLEDGVTSIGDYAFSSCSSLTSVRIPGSVSSIGTWAFGYCSSLLSVSIPEGVTSIADYAFSNCTSLSSVTIPKSVTNIGNYAFANCTSLTDVYYVGTETSWNEISIGDGNESLTGATIHFAERFDENLLWILNDQGTLIISGMGEMADYQSGGAPWYSKRTSITNVVLEDGVTGIGDYAFYACLKLKTISIPEGVKRVGSHAFDSCSKLEEITLPKAVTSIGDDAFSGCRSLTSVTIPESMTSIADYAFSNCSSLTSVTIPESVTSIGKYAFSWCSSLTSVAIPEGVTNIEQGVFAGCSSLTSMVIPEGVTSIGTFAFSDCSNLTSVTIPEGVTSIGVGAFDDCTSLTNVAIPEGVTSIRDGAFSGCTSLTSVTIPEGVTSVSFSCFSNCTSLTSITIPDGVTTIDSAAFSGCSCLASVVLPQSVIDIRDQAFFKCTSLKEISLPLMIDWIGDSAFEGCTGLETIVIPKRVYSIGDATFKDCTALTSVTISNNVTSIGEQAFCGCTSLPEVRIPNGVKTIVNSSFRDCEKLELVTIPSGVTKVEHYAFDGCNALTKVIYEGTEESWGNISIKSHNDPLLNADRQYVQTLSDVTRVAGAGRWATAIKVADELKATLGVEKFDAIIVASGNNFADALAGSYLATVKNAPILLSYGMGGKYAYLDTDNIDYIKANLAENGTVYILGGNAAVPASYEEMLEEIGVKYERLSGSNRYGTNLAILEAAGLADGSEILVCTGESYADSLSASATGKPILLVQEYNGKFYGIDANFLDGHNYNFTIIGGESAVSAGVKIILESYGSVDRLAGGNRFETSVKVAERYFNSPDSAVLAYAWNYPDGLCGGALAYVMKAPLILTMENWETAAVTYARESNITTGYVLGGAGLVTDSIARAFFGMAEDAPITQK